MNCPTLSFVPQSVHGTLVIMATLAYAGRGPGGRAGDDAVPGAREAACRSAPADAVCGVVPAGQPRLSPHRRGANDVRRAHRPRGRRHDHRAPRVVGRVHARCPGARSRRSPWPCARRCHRVCPSRQRDHDLSDGTHRRSRGPGQARGLARRLPRRAPPGQRCRLRQLSHR